MMKPFTNSPLWIFGLPFIFRRMVQHSMLRFCGQQIEITPSIISDALKLNDADDPDVIPIASLFFTLHDLGYQGKVSSSMEKRLLGGKWRFLVEVINRCMSRKTDSKNEIPTNLQFVFHSMVTSEPFSYSKYLFFCLADSLNPKFKRYAIFPRFLSRIFRHILGDRYIASGELFSVDRQNKLIFTYFRKDIVDGSDRSLTPHMFRLVYPEFPETLIEDEPSVDVPDIENTETLVDLGYDSDYLDDFESDRLEYQKFCKEVLKRKMGKRHSIVIEDSTMSKRFKFTASGDCVSASSCTSVTGVSPSGVKDDQANSVKDPHPASIVAETETVKSPEAEVLEVLDSLDGSLDLNVTGVPSPSHCGVSRPSSAPVACLPGEEPKGQQGPGPTQGWVRDQAVNQIVTTVDVLEHSKANDTGNITGTAPRSIGTSSDHLMAKCMAYLMSSMDLVLKKLDIQVDGVPSLDSKTGEKHSDQEKQAGADAEKEKEVEIVSEDVLEKVAAADKGKEVVAGSFGIGSEVPATARQFIDAEMLSQALKGKAPANEKVGAPIKVPLIPLPPRIRYTRSTATRLSVAAADKTPVQRIRLPSSSYSSSDSSSEGNDSDEQESDVEA